MGVVMAESATWTTRGAEISERSSELVLPEHASPENAGTTTDEIMRATPQGAGRATVQEPESPRADRAGDRSERPATAAGIALPGDRGPRSGAARPQRSESREQRPSFWRRIALGRRAAAAEPPPPETATQTRSPARTTSSSEAPASSSSRSLVEAEPAPVTAPDIESRIVEPMLQALVSVEAKLERSHVELMGRSDQVESRLGQLWDIEEQLGALGEMQDSLLQVSEQQRRLEAAIRSQTRTTRWLVGAVLASLAAAAFFVAAILR